MTVFADVWPRQPDALADLGVVTAAPRGGATWVCTSCGAQVMDSTWARNAHEGFHRQLGWLHQLADQAARLADELAADRQNELTEGETP